MPPRDVPTLPGWVPSAAVVGSVLVLLLLLVSTFAGGVNDAGQQNEESNSADVAALQSTSPPATEAAATITPAAEPTVSATEPVVATEPAAATEPAVSQPAVAVSTDGAILPEYRVLSFYGHPLDEKMGVLGEYGTDLDSLLIALRAEQARYEAADPNRPVKLALELIASVAQDWPADDDTYLLHTGSDIIDRYIAFCQENDLELILDLQIGHSTVEKEIDIVRPYLAYPFVHLALDPEFAMREGDIPGTAIGTVDATDVTFAQESLAAISAEFGLPPKMLIVHRFTENMITNSSTVAPVPGVQLVIDFDGYGEPAQKISGYELFITGEPIEFGGMKLFYRQDSPLLTADEVVNLIPPPDLVIYQ